MSCLLNMADLRGGQMTLQALPAVVVSSFLTCTFFLALQVPPPAPLHPGACQNVYFFSDVIPIDPCSAYIASKYSHYSRGHALHTGMRV